MMVVICCNIFIVSASPSVAPTTTSSKKKTKATKEEKKEEQVKVIEEPVQEVKQEVVQEIAEIPPVEAVIVEEPVPEEVSIATPVVEVTAATPVVEVSTDTPAVEEITPAEPVQEEAKLVEAGSKPKNKSDKSQTKKAPKKVNKETNNNENTIAPKKEAVIEPPKEVTAVDISPASEPVAAEGKTFDVQVFLLWKCTIRWIRFMDWLKWTNPQDLSC